MRDFFYFRGRYINKNLITNFHAVDNQLIVCYNNELPSRFNYNSVEEAKKALAEFKAALSQGERLS
jgi:hypothetical protein